MLPSLLSKRGNMDALQDLAWVPNAFRPFAKRLGVWLEPPLLVCEAE